MKKQIVTKMTALLMTSAMMLSVAACGDSGNESRDSGSDAARSGEETGSGEEKESANSDGSENAGNDGASGNEAETDGGYEARDMQGRTIKIGLWWQEYWDSNYRTLEEVKAAGGEYDNAEIMQMKLDRIAELEEKWNCRIEWVNLGWEGVIDSINTSIPAGKPDCDIYMDNVGIPAIVNGYIAKISSYAPADADILTDQKIVAPRRVFGSDDYFFCDASTYVIPGSACYMVYNADMLADLNLEAPEALAERGEWTWEKFAEYARICTRDLDGDGNTDVWGYGNNTEESLYGFAPSNNAQFTASTTEGLSSIASVETFEFLDRLYNVDGTARPDFGAGYDMLKEGLVAFTFCRPWAIRPILEESDVEARICPAPVGPSGDGTQTAAIAANAYFIPVGVEDPTAVYMIFEEMLNWYHDDTSFRDDPEWFEACFVDPEQVELAYQEGAKHNGDQWSVADTSGAIHNVLNSILVDKDMTVAQSIETNKQMMQEKLDEVAAGMK